MTWGYFAIAALLLAALLLFKGRPLLAWVLPLVLAALNSAIIAKFEMTTAVWVVTTIVSSLLLFLAIPAIRRLWLTRGVMTIVSKILPTLSATEREALEAGTVWWDGEIFSGNPDWQSWLESPTSSLSPREQEFIDGPVEELALMADNWSDRQRGDLSPQAWEFLKEKGFFGMIIPQEYGGLEFSAQAISTVIAKLSTASSALCVSTMVPNSLGPGELLLHYGTDEQRKHYLPRLARGEDIPCFALTEPNAGSDAGSLTSSAVVCKKTVDGEEVVGIRLNWDKRYITLAPVATLLGLAFRLYDPDGILGDVEDLGITCGLVPTDTPGVVVGERHDPLGVPFMNGPTTGEDVFVGLDAIIGGAEMAGKGWRMLMQCLSAGRGISIPSMSGGVAQMCTRVTGAYSSVREQFGLPIGKLEGVQEPLVRIAGLGYALNALRVSVASAVDQGEKPAVASAIAKYISTDTLRGIVNDAMDIFGGAGICRGPRNILATPYSAMPVSITVEGANILTRTMIIFGQGAIRCHPWAQHEMQAAAEGNLAAFDRAFFGHVGFVATTVVRTVVHRLTGGRLARNDFDGAIGRCQQRLTQYSAAFALASDLAMATLGGALKRKERLTGRLADALCWLFVGSTVLKRFHDEGRPEADRLVVRWALEHAIKEIDTALRGFRRNLPHRPAAWAYALLATPLFDRPQGPSDGLGVRIAESVLDGQEVWKRLSREMIEPPPGSPGYATIEAALTAAIAARPISRAIKSGIRDKKIEKRPSETLVERAVSAGIIDEEGRRILDEARRTRDLAIAVDNFPAGDSPANSPRAVNTTDETVSKP